MAFRFGDPGGRVYGTITNILAYWSVVTTTAPWSVSAGNGRSTGSCLRLAMAATTNTIYKNLDNQATWGIAFGFKPSVAQATNAYSVAFFADSGTPQVTLRLNTSGTLSVYRGTSSGGTLLGTTATSISYGSWNHIEFKTTINATTGTVQVWINGVSQLSLTSQNTRNTANSSANQIVIGTDTTTTPTASNWDYDDIIVYDGQTTDAANNPDITGPIGDCGLAWLLPSGAGSSTQFSPDSANPNYSRLTDTTPDTTSYVESSTVNNLDLYALTDPAANVGTIKSLQVISYARKTDVGSRGARAVLRTASTNYVHTNEISLSDSYLYYSSGWGVNPNTGVAWTTADINGLEIGPKVSS
jgi:hypothetical protein